MRIFSGIQPTGTKHLGNYIGGITQYVAGQDRGDPAIYCIVNLHSLTVDYDPADLRERTLDLAALLIAAGLDPDRCILFRQGDVKEHSELSWLLSAVIPLGELQRMHQFRDKSVAQRELVSAGLLFYPVLMAADVLAYRAHEVPVGEDQREHVELMRDAAERFNRRFGETLVVPEARIPTVGARIRDLQDPSKKMSTTSPSPAGTVYVLDEPDVIMKKFKRAVTDSGTDDRPRPRQARDLEPDRAARGGPRDERRRRSSASSPARATATSRSRWGRRSSSTSARCASATPSCARTRPSSGGSWRRAPRARGRWRPRRSPTCASAWASPE